MKLLRGKKRHFFDATVLLYIMECFSGFSMAIATFCILPLSIEIAGLITSFIGVLLGAVIFFIFKNIFGNIANIWMAVNLFVCAVYHLERFPFDSYTGNGLYLGILAGIVLSVQTDCFCGEKESKIQKKSGAWYLFGVLLGILLK